MHYTYHPNSNAGINHAQPHTDACTPNEFFPHTPLPLPQPTADPGSFAPAEGLEAEDGARSALKLVAKDFSFVLSPNPRGEGTGGVERLFNPGVGPCPAGRLVPMGATAGTPGPAESFACRGGEPPGDEVEVRLDC